jgi:hypothetical protein
VRAFPFVAAIEYERTDADGTRSGIVGTTHDVAAHIAFNELHQIR